MPGYFFNLYKKIGNTKRKSMFGGKYTLQK